MIRSSLLLSLMTAMFATESNGSTPTIPSKSSASQTTTFDPAEPVIEKTEDQQIQEDARRAVGKDLCDL